MSSSVLQEPLAPGFSPSQVAGRPSRLVEMLVAAESFPVLRETRRRVREAVEAPGGDLGPAIAAVETDVGAALLVLRTVNRGVGSAGAGIATVPDAVDHLGPVTLEGLFDGVPMTDPLAAPGSWGSEPEAQRRHGTAVQAAVRRIVTAVVRTGGEPFDAELMSTAALLHDVGRIVLRGGRPADGSSQPGPGTGEGLRAEREAFGFDHAVVGGVLLRRWDVPHRLARLVERHHADDLSREILVLRLGDLIAHHGHGDRVAPRAALGVGTALGLDTAAVRALIYDQALPAGTRRLGGVPSPLSGRETDVLRQLAMGRTYIQIGQALGIAPSTVRTHLHSMYAKIGVSDRAQAVLVAVDRGWIEV